MHVIEYECGTWKYVSSTRIFELSQCLRNQLATLKAENVKLLEENRCLRAKQSLIDSIPVVPDVYLSHSYSTTAPIPVENE